MPELYTLLAYVHIYTFFFHLEDFNCAIGNPHKEATFKKSMEQGIVYILQSSIYKSMAVQQAPSASIRIITPFMTLMSCEKKLH